MKSFFKALIIGTIIIFIVGFFPFLSWWKPYKVEIFSSFMLSLINAIAGYILVIKYHGAEQNKFMLNIYGGMIIRMAFVLGFSLYMTMNGYLQTTPFFMFLMFFYVVHQWTEITSWLKILPSRKVQVN